MEPDLEVPIKEQLNTVVKKLDIIIQSAWIHRSKLPSVEEFQRIMRRAVDILYDGVLPDCTTEESQTSSRAESGGAIDRFSEPPANENEVLSLHSSDSGGNEVLNIHGSDSGDDGGKLEGDHSMEEDGTDEMIVENSEADARWRQWRSYSI